MSELILFPCCYIASDLPLLPTRDNRSHKVLSRTQISAEIIKDRILTAQCLALWFLCGEVNGSAIVHLLISIFPVALAERQRERPGSGVGDRSEERKKNAHDREDPPPKKVSTETQSPARTSQDFLSKDPGDGKKGTST